MRGLKALNSVVKHRASAGLWGPGSAHSWAPNMPTAGVGAVMKKIPLCLGGAGLHDTEQMDFLYSM